ncbi:serine hydrolase domain-containing protein [Thalassotalea atypica]|uniref:serine hydrolase domain-containing protein n=1 Tax=Thalassotalea atypica TaxID=2054316 RepID=UPI0025729C08|nr:serine hydrolase [Thalassotalea atypica]
MASSLFKKVLTFTLALCLYSCGSGDGGSNPVCGCSPPLPLYEYEMPASQNDGWSVGHAGDTGLNIQLITQLVNDITQGKYVNIDGIVIAKQGQLVFEHYFNGFHANRPHQLQSASKSIGSLLTGILLDQQSTLSVDEKIQGYFPQHQDLVWDNDKSDITIEHLLTMSAGFDCFEGTQPQKACDGGQLNASGNWSRYTLAANMAFAPGSQWRYFTGIPILLHEIIEQQSQLALAKFSQDYLFTPLQIDDATWSHSPSDEALALEMTPRSMAKLGQLFLNQGQWLNQQVISQSWLEQSLIPRFTIDDQLDYGYLWYQDKWFVNEQLIDTYQALGDGEQKIIFIPMLDMVIAFTTSNYSFADNSVHGQTSEIIEQYIIPAILNQ